VGPGSDTALRHVERALADSERRLSAVVDLAPLVLFACDAAGTITLLRGAGLQALRVDAGTLIGTNVFALLDDSGRHDVSTLLERALQGEETHGVMRFGDTVFEGSFRPQRASSGAIAGVIAVYHDVTLAHRSQEQVRHMAYHDPLTGLPNRARLEERLAEGLARGRRTGRALALLYIDLDEFKLVNDSLGHAAGDELLCEVAQRLDATTRACDLLARHGGDEFMLLVEDLEPDDEHAVEAVAANVLAALAPPFTVDGAEFQVGASIGVSVWPRHGREPAELLQHADAALYQAKAQGRGVHAIYDPRTGSSRGRLTLTARLRRALEQDEFELHYQPIYGLAGGEQLAMEALVRWRDPERGLVLPGDFIGVAEGSGLIDDLGTWVLEEACRQMRAWIDAGLEPYVSVNVAPRQLRDAWFARRVAHTLDRFGLEPNRLMIEVTESAAMLEPQRTDPLLREVGELGVRLGIDDFGTGHSSLARLQALPFEALKIDRSFLRGVPEGRNETRMLSAVLALAGALGMSVVAEGIETDAQRAFLAGAGCQYGQGFLLGRPVPAGEIAATMRR
jgi:diguanylate cyclase (GGDEF)-like protein